MKNHPYVGPSSNPPVTKPIYGRRLVPHSTDLPPHPRKWRGQHLHGGQEGWGGQDVQGGQEQTKSERKGGQSSAVGACVGSAESKPLLPLKWRRQ